MWCLNASLLKDEGFKAAVKECVKDAVSDPLFESDVSVWWEGLKGEFKRLAISSARQANVLRRREERILKSRLLLELEKVENCPGYDVTEYLRVREELRVVERHRCMGAVVRSRAQYVVDGEKNTAFFLGLERRMQERSFLTELLNERGERVTDLEGILNTVHSFYKGLFTSGGVDEVSMRRVLEAVEARVSTEDAEMCDADFTLAEIEAAILGLNLNKSPGSDGLTAEFYREFRDILAPLMLRVYVCMEEKRVVPESLAMGVLTMLYKGKGSRLKLENYRPITLLNSDNKVLAKIMANRLNKVMGSIIAPTQAYGVPGRDVVDTLCTIRDVVKQMQEVGGAVLCLDLNKAFDRVEHRFLLEALARFGFGPRLKEWVKLLYGSACSVVKCNGVLTDSFPLGRSVRQGCPLSALLYSISVEPLAAFVKRDGGVHGVDLPGGGVSVMHHYADDTTCTVRDGESVNCLMKCFDVYGRASGAKVNVEKSQMLCADDNVISTCNIPFKTVKGHVRILGVNIGVDEREARDLTWTGVINKIKTTLNCWKQRKLKLRGKVVVVNALLMSKCVYTLGVMDMPEWVLKGINNLVSDFLWGGKGVKIAHDVMIANYDRGGLRLIDLEVKLKAMRVKRVQRFLYGEEGQGWKEFFRHWLHRSGGCGDYGLLMCFKPSMYAEVPEFYQEVFRAWAEFLPQVSYECDSIGVILNIPVFLNPMLKSEGKMMESKVIMKAGMIRVRDFRYEVVPGFLPDQAIVDTVWGIDEDVRKGTVLRMYERIKECVPGEWVRLLDNHSSNGVLETLPEMKVKCGETMQALSSTQVRALYWAIITRKVRAPASEKVWRQVFPGMEVETLWENMVVRLNSLECTHFDFMLRHNRVFTKVVLHQVDRSVSRVCDVCRDEDENLMHMMFECVDVAGFYVRLREMLERYWGEEIIGGGDWRWLVLFGVGQHVRGVNIVLLNFMLSHARYAVYSRRNLARFEGKRVTVWKVFEGLIRKDVDLMYRSKQEDFEKVFMKDCGFITVGEDGGLVYGF